MAEFEYVVKIVLLVASLLAAIVGVLKNTAAISKALKTSLPLIASIYKTLKPILASVVFLATIVIPNGLTVWGCLYIATINSSRMGEAKIFLLAFAQFTLAASIYTFCWGKWAYPRLSLWLKKQRQESSRARAEEKQKQGRTDRSEISEQ